MTECENVTVTGCTLTSTSSALIIGAECRAPIRNVVFDACVIQSSHRGLAIRLPDYFRHALEAHAEMVQSLRTQISADAR